MPKALELSGKSFYALTALKRAGSKNGTVVWKCLCVCGKTVNVRSISLTSGNTKSCGCRKAGRDKTGNRYGRLTVVKKLRRKGPKSASLWLCLCDCGNSKVAVGFRLGKFLNSCGCLLNERLHAKGPDSRAWKGGRYISKSMGYVFVQDPAHPNAYSDGYVLEHVQIMSKHLGRPLRKDEVVHHKNGHRSDNSLGNLELCLKKKYHPPGQRVEDLLQYAISLIDRYPDIAAIVRKRMKPDDPVFDVDVFNTKK